jgi:uncharacterized membrane protein
MGGKKRVGAIIGEAIGYYKRNFLLFLITALAVYGLGYLIGQLGNYVIQAAGHGGTSPQVVQINMDGQNLQLVRPGSIFASNLLVLPQILLIFVFFICENAVYINAYDVMLKLHAGHKPSFREIVSDFLHRWVRYLGIAAWSMLWTALWSFVFIIPGIVKSISYMFAPLLIIEYPDMTIRQALQKSREMTYGYKGRLFGLYMCIGLPLLIVMIAFYIIIMSLGIYETHKFIINIISPIFSLFILVPLGYMANTVAYADIKKAAVKKGIL